MTPGPDSLAQLADSVSTGPSIELIGVIGTWVSGILTFLAVFLAVLFQHVWTRLTAPSLKVIFDPTSSEFVRYLQDVGHPRTEELWIRIGVRNSRVKGSSGVQIRHTGTLRGEGTIPESRANLWFKASGIDAVALTPLPKGIDQYYDVAFARHVEGQEQIDLRLVLVRPPPDLLSWDDEKLRILTDDDKCALEVGESYSIGIAVLSEDAKARLGSLRLKLNVPQNGWSSSLLGEAEFLKALEVAWQKRRGWRGLG